MEKMTFNMLFAIGITWSTGAILRIDSQDNFVKEAVLGDIREMGDIDFMEFLGYDTLNKMPRQSLLLARVWMTEMPTDCESGTYKLLQLSVFDDSVLNEKLIDGNNLVELIPQN